MNAKGLTLLLVVVAAAIVSAPASAKPHDITMTLVPPLVFGDPTSDCPQGTATFDVSSTAGRGSAAVCLLTSTPVTPCPGDICTQLTDVLTFMLPGGTITASAVQSEVDSFDPVSGNFTVELEFEGEVTQATHRFHKLLGNSFSGGGATVFGADGSVSPNLNFVISA